MANVAKLSCILFALVFFSVKMVEARQVVFPTLDHESIKESVYGNCTTFSDEIKNCVTKEGKAKCDADCYFYYKNNDPTPSCQVSSEYPTGRCACNHNIC
ncbi:hypothetical protein ACP275_01G082500 [Erythranthe tilingii]